MVENKKYIIRIAELVREMIAITNSGEDSCRDDGCRVFFGIIRDSAYRCKKEIKRHHGDIVPLGFWDQGNSK